MVYEFLSVEVENGIFIDSDEGISARKMMIDTQVILKRIDAFFAFSTMLTTMKKENLYKCV